MEKSTTHRGGHQGKAGEYCNRQSLSAESYMTRAVPIVAASARVADVRTYVHTYVKSFVTVDYLYVTDRHGVFIGILSYRTLLAAPSTKRIDMVCTRGSLITIAPNAPVDEAAYRSLHHDVSSIVVIDAQQRLLGVITAAGITHILHRRRIEALFHRTGVAKEHTFDTVMETPLLRAVRHRIPWLVLGLFGGLLAAKIIGSFEQTLERNLILAAFIPLVVYIADAVGTQLEAFAIRDLALSQKLSLAPYFFRQLSIVAIISVLLGAVALAFSFFMYQALREIHKYMTSFP